MSQLSIADCHSRMELLLVHKLSELLLRKRFLKLNIQKALTNKQLKTFHEADCYMIIVYAL